MKKYEELREQYPKYISKDQMYRICGIAKRSADYLIKHGVIPVIDTGKKTWRYRIALEDVIAYLYKRDKNGSPIPRGAVSSRHKYDGERVCFASMVRPGRENEIAKYFDYLYTDFPDVLTTSDVVEMTGLSKKTILQFLNAGDLKFVEKYPHYLIPKCCLLEFVSTSRFVDCKSNSDIFKKILGGFELWKTAKL